MPHEIVVNLAAFFELCDALILLWVQSSQGMMSDAGVNEVRDVPVFLLSDIFLGTKILRGTTNFSIVVCPILFEKLFL